MMKRLSTIITLLLVAGSYGSIWAQVSAVSKEPFNFDFSIQEPKQESNGEPKNEQTFAVIIANENYKSESQVIFAKNDGESLKKCCIQTLNMPEKNVHYITDATLNEIRREMNWLDKVAEAFEGELNIIFYYAGHGIPDEKSQSAYLLPVDGYGSDVESGYKIDD